MSDLSRRALAYAIPRTNRKTLIILFALAVVAIGSVVAAGAILSPADAAAYPSFLPPPRPGYKWVSYCGLQQLRLHGTWCHWTQVRI